MKQNPDPASRVSGILKSHPWKKKKNCWMNFLIISIFYWFIFYLAQSYYYLNSTLSGEHSSLVWRLRRGGYISCHIGRWLSYPWSVSVFDKQCLLRYFLLSCERPPLHLTCWLCRPYGQCERWSVAGSLVRCRLRRVLSLECVESELASFCVE